LNSKQREKIVVIGGSIVFFTLLYLLVFLFPTLTKIRNSEKNIKTDEKNLVKLRELLEQHGSSAAKPTNRIEGSLSAFIERKAREMNITIAFIRPYGEEGRGVEIKIDEMDGDSILRFVYEMETNGINITRLNIRDFRNTGIWVVRMNLET
jgi:type II secretory pathway component PulM